MARAFRERGGSEGETGWCRKPVQNTLLQGGPWQQENTYLPRTQRGKTEAWDLTQGMRKGGNSGRPPDAQLEAVS